MASKRHLILNVMLIILPWLSTIFLGKRSFKRFYLSSVVISVFEIINHYFGHQKKWWKFYDKPTNFLRDELPFDIGPYMPVSMWILKFSYGNFKKYVLLNAIVHGLFSFLFMPFLKKIKILHLKRINYFQFFLYIHYKAYILYALQYLIEKVKGYNVIRF
ncbi:hypothetical protein J2Z40_003556 [Cytobacillus eiseniae]|uniref:Uncharacterized protein n=1 Tax=Cytobacillus eiseniae TaxID=762947 RepID=A0ABS4RJR5_9BACI|nr:hypothetical protein [Cytobacillus eiseniae]MBP2242974.1 hypothetical protein [Cytobacillus eiseniae]